MTSFRRWLKMLQWSRETVPECAIRLTTGPGDTVLDPFADSLVTASAAQRLGRHFIVCDRSRCYLEGGILQLAA